MKFKFQIAKTAHCLAVTLLIASSAVAGPVQSRGGSDYAFYAVDGCDRDKYGVIHQYDQAHELIDKQLTTMYANGQRRLRLPIFFGHGLDSGVNMDSTGGDLPSKFKDNLTGLLAAVKKTGFEEVEISFHPQAGNFPWKWHEWNEQVYQENWNLIVHLRSIFVASGLPYRIDLMNEGTPASNQQMMLRYDQRLWSDYTGKYGKDDTIGFSVIPEPDRIKQIPAVYGHNPPNAFDFHPYKDAGRDLMQADEILKPLGLGGIPWIIGESYYDDAGEATEIENAIEQTGHKVLFVLQWPLTRAQKCPGVDTVPLDFDKYAEHGF